MDDMSSHNIMSDWIEDNSGQRYGQYFCNKYISKSWPELFYCTNDYESAAIISKWLIEHQYEYDMPPLRKKTP